MRALARYIFSMVMVSIVSATQQSLGAGEGLLEGILSGVLGFLRLGWIAAIVCSPLLLVLLWFLPPALDPWPGLPSPIVAAVLSAAIWAIAFNAFAFVVMLTGRSSQPDSTALSLAFGIVLGSGAVGAIGATIGFVEGVAWRTWPRRPRSTAPAAVT